MLFCRSDQMKLLRELLRPDFPPQVWEPPTPAREPKPVSNGPVPALLTMKLIREFFVPVNERTLDRWISAERFPKPDVRMGGKVRMWKRETVEEWVEENSEDR